MSSLLYQSKPTTQILIPAGLSNFEKGVYYLLNLARTVSKTSVQKRDETDCIMALIKTPRLSTR